MDRNMPVSAIMTEPVITLYQNDSLNIVEKTFASKSFHHILIVDVDQHIKGMVSKIDLLQLSAIKRDLSEREFKFLKVKDFMTHNLTVITPETTVEKAATLFYENKFHALPVVANAKATNKLSA